jgi:hypothetical protein
MRVQHAEIGTHLTLRYTHISSFINALSLLRYSEYQYCNKDNLDMKVLLWPVKSSSGCSRPSECYITAARWVNSVGGMISNSQVYCIGQRVQLSRLLVDYLLLCESFPPPPPLQTRIGSVEWNISLFLSFTLVQATYCRCASEMRGRCWAQAVRYRRQASTGREFETRTHVSASVASGDSVV